MKVSVNVRLVVQVELVGEWSTAETIARIQAFAGRKAKEVVDDAFKAHNENRDNKLYLRGDNDDPPVEIVVIR